jgi:putative nucleotidyltransferase with HDIG domain
MDKLPISREEAIRLIEKTNSDKADMIHFLESEVIMGALAKRFNEDVSYWRMLGLLHDVDWALTKEDSRQHLTRAPEILRGAGFDERFIQIVVSHGYGWDCAGLKDMKRAEKAEFALASAETITGLIHTYGILRKGFDGMEVSGLKKRMKDKRFAAGINREIIMECEKMGLSLDEFCGIAIEAVKSIAKDVGF